MSRRPDPAGPRRLALVPVAFGALALPLVGPKDEPSADTPGFHPEAEAGWEPVWIESATWVLDDATLELNGEPQEFQIPEMEARLERSVRFSDRAVAVGAGRVRTLRRGFDALQGRFELDYSVGGESESYAFELVSPLADEAVVFQAQEDGAGYTVGWEDDTGPDDAYLAGLRFQAAAESLLPTEAVEPGASWEPSGAALVAFVAPGGDLNLRPASDPGGSIFAVPNGALIGMSGIALGELADADWKGEAEVRFEGVEERDGRQVAVLALRLDGTFTADRSDALLRSARAVDLPEGDYAFEVSLEVDGEGELVWDLEEGLPRSAHVELETFINAHGSWPESHGGGVDLDFVFGGSFESSGKTTLTLERGD